MKKYTVVDIITDETGDYCSPQCPHFAGACDAFKPHSLKRVPNMSYWYRHEQCKKRETNLPEVK